MAFAASGNPANQATITSGAGSVTVPVPQLVDVAGNGFSGNAFSHCQLGAGPPQAINPASNTVTVPQGAAAAILYFGSMQS